MRVLFITQKIDQEDGVLGIYHEWVKGLAAHVEAVYAVTLFKGKTDLPRNVTVHSLEKERGAPRFLRKFVYSIRFYKALWQIGKSYDAVFVHMNKEYVLLGALLWKLFNTRIVFWYNHPEGDWRTKIAIGLSDAVLFTSPLSFAAESHKGVRMPVGVLAKDAASFHLRQELPAVVSVGRLSPVKRVDQMIRACGLLIIRGFKLRFDLYGDPVDRAEDRVYQSLISDELSKLGNAARKHPGVPHDAIALLFRDADVSLNLTKTGSMDKTIFESCAVGTPCVTSNQALRTMFPQQWADLLVAEEGNPESVAEKIERVLSLDDEHYKELRKELSEWVAREHSLEALLSALVEQLAIS